MSAEGESSPQQSGLLRRLAERLHIVPTPAEQALIDQERIESTERMLKVVAESNIRHHMIWEHSNASTGEALYIMGYYEDPSPGHAIVFSECNHTFDEKGHVVVFEKTAEPPASQETI